MQTFQEMKHRRFFTEVTSLIMNSSVNFISVLLWLMHIYICLAFPFFKCVFGKSSLAYYIGIKIHTLAGSLYFVLKLTNYS